LYKILYCFILYH